MPATKTTIAMMIHFFEDLLAMMFLPHGSYRLLWRGCRRRCCCRLRREQVAPIGAVLHLRPYCVGNEWLTYAHLPTAAECFVQTDDVRRGIRAQIDEFVVLLQ